MEITVRIKDQYGTAVIHPVCDKAHAFAALAGTKTLTRAALTQIRALGYAVNVQAPEIRF